MKAMQMGVKFNLMKSATLRSVCTLYSAHIVKVMQSKVFIFQLKNTCEIFKEYVNISQFFLVLLNLIAMTMATAITWKCTIVEKIQVSHWIQKTCLYIRTTYTHLLIHSRTHPWTHRVNINACENPFPSYCNKIEDSA